MRKNFTPSMNWNNIKNCWCFTIDNFLTFNLNLQTLIIDKFTGVLKQDTINSDKRKFTTTDDCKMDTAHSWVAPSLSNEKIWYLYEK